ncbi:Retrovirus-related Pol polyprotein from transposon TNT 1-94 [Podarcis lilfordi]|uniref:Retrovirus-related Pol polyprotein from transposon TNT 1-94 n=1 Tax=Podarcis lilfordi TaxID=74358 RepID=A0AA35LN29_9SAUR|nr:Retrovirus-related Pol polyprotein from transposon TNT 1-94 [Podarcis lilfordi]
MAFPFAMPFERLNNHNYLLRSRRMQATLQRVFLWESVDKPLLKPDAEDRDRDQRAKVTLILGLDDLQLPHVRRLDSARDVWLVLRNLHIRETANSKLSIRKALHKSELKPGVTMQNHLHDLQLKFVALQERGCNFPEEEKVCIILSSLPDCWDNLVLTLEAMCEEDLTLDYVTGRLLEEWQRREGKELSASSALSSDRLVRNAGSISEEKQPKQRTRATAGEEAAFAVRRCYRCGSTRHLRKQCPEEVVPESPKQHKQKKFGKKKQTTQLVTVECSV